MDIKEAFQRHGEGEFLKFERIPEPRHPRRDICAFLMLADLVPGTGPVIAASEHDEFFLDVDCGALAKVATDDAIRDLVRCGVRYDSGYDCLAMFS